MLKPSTEKLLQVYFVMQITGLTLSALYALGAAAFVILS